MIAKKVAIITGSGTGIGAAIAIKLASIGVNIVVNYNVSENEAKKTISNITAIGAEALLCKADITSDNDCRNMVQKAVEKWGRIDYLVNNAGTTKFVEHTNLDGLNSEDFHKIYAVNVIGAYQMIRAVAPYMRTIGHGSVVNISSVAGTLAIGSSIAYAASKAALNNMTLALARVLAPEIRVNAICPGFVETRWFKKVLGDDGYKKKVAEIESTTPLQVASNADHIADTVVCFLKDNPHVTGEIIQVDAGLHLLVGNK